MTLSRSLSRAERDVPTTDSRTTSGCVQNGIFSLENLTIPKSRGV
jgi:hypothetical protein